MDAHFFDFFHIRHLKQTHPVWRLLNADNAPLILSFCFQAFIEHNRRSVSEEILESFLTDYLLYLRETYGEENFPRSAKEYLEQWAGESCEFLRKYYPQRSEEAEYDLTPATEKVIEWLHELQPKEFVGTESRLLIIFRLLKDIVDVTEENPEERLRTLQQQKKEIEAAIEDVKHGIQCVYSPTQIRERYIQAEDTARKLLSEFRQIEHNFRALDRNTRERITKSEEAKGKLLDEIFFQHDAIRTSDQGRSFQAFWELLMSPKQQANLTHMLEKIFQLPEFNTVGQQGLLKDLYPYLLEAGERVYKINRLLASQLRKFLDDQLYLQNKRLAQLIRNAEKKIFQLKDTLSQEKHLMDIPSFKIDMNNIIARSLYVIPCKPIVSDLVQVADKLDLDMNILFNRWVIDETLLRDRIESLLQQYPKISLQQIMAHYPVEKGLSEIIAYIKIAHSSNQAHINEAETEEILFKNAHNAVQIVRLNKIVFVRGKR
ncbi:MAG TPA: DUF3375 domain-containing protein [Gammaproteobacteria bacterium]|nr:DUF3375 domain-containing protein [Gammaproteobacteria bacterium]